MKISEIHPFNQNQYTGTLVELNTLTFTVYFLVSPKQINATPDTCLAPMHMSE